MYRTFRGIAISFIALLSLAFASEAFAQFATRTVKIEGFGTILTPLQRQNQVTNHLLNNNIPITPGVTIQAIWTRDWTSSRYLIDANHQIIETETPRPIDNFTQESGTQRLSSCSGSRTRIDEYGYWAHWTITGTADSSGSTWFTEYIVTVQVALCNYNYSVDPVGDPEM